MKSLRYTAPIKMLCSIVLLWAMMPAQSFGQTISTVVGRGTADNVPATNAALDDPTGVFVDGSGNLYIADFNNNRVRKVDAVTGIITTVAGNGTAGFSGDGGPAVSASLNHPYRVSVDSSGNVYFAEQFNHRVRKVDAVTGIITTIAGNGTLGFSGDGGPAIAAKLRSPAGVHVDGAGNIYIADFVNHRIRKVDAVTNNITTIAGGVSGIQGDGGPAIAARLKFPVDVYVDGMGNIYIADFRNHRVRKVDTSGIITTIAGGGAGDGGPVSEANLNVPWGVHIDNAGNLYIADSQYHRVRKVDTSGNITTIAGTGYQGFSGDGGQGSLAELNEPLRVFVDGAGNVYIGDTSNNRVRKVDTDGIITTVAGNGTAGFSGDGGPAISASLRFPWGVHVDGIGNLYIADFFNRRIRKVDTSGIITTVAGNGTAGFSGAGGPAISASLNGLFGISLDGIGNLYIADRSNHRIRKVDTFGIITTVAGNGTAGFSGDGGPAISASLNGVFGISLDATGNLYIADSSNQRVRKVDTSGIITTVAGTGTLGFSGDGGPAINATMYNPVDVSINSSGNLYIADVNNDRIRKVSNVAPPTNQPLVADAGGPYSVDEGGSVTVVATGSDPDDDPITFAWDLDNNGTFETPGQSGPFSAAGLDGPSTKTIAVQVTDDGGLSATDQATVNVQNVAPTAGTITAPVDPVQVGTEISAGASFTDPGTPDTHTAVWNWGDESTSTGTVGQENDTVNGTHTYTVAGVYTVTLTVTDDDGDSGESIFQFVVVYDPSAGFVTGGGWIDSPAGAYTADPSLTGKANFGFVSKYKKGATTPTGQTQFKFKTGDLNFHSTEYDWLVVAGPHAKYKGSGTINGSGVYGFMVTATDGEVNGGGGVDKFRMKIWDKGTEGVVYDNQQGDGDNADAADAIEGGSIVIHSGGGASKPAVGGGFALLQNAPNPFNPSTQIAYELAESAQVRLVIYNVLGQSVRVLAQEHQEEGYYQVRWDGRDALGRTVSTGLYIYKLEAGPNVAIRKMILAK